MVNTLWVNADHGPDFHPLADHMTKLQNFTKGEIREFSAFPFPLQLVFDQTLSNLIVLSDDSTKTTNNSCTNEVARCNGYLPHYMVGLIFHKMNLK